MKKNEETPSILFTAMSDPFMQPLCYGVVVQFTTSTSHTNPTKLEHHPFLSSIPGLVYLPLPFLFFISTDKLDCCFFLLPIFLFQIDITDNRVEGGRKCGRISFFLSFFYFQCLGILIDLSFFMNHPCSIYSYMNE